MGNKNIESVMQEHRVFPPTAEFIKQANALCKTMNEQVEALPDPGNDPAKRVEALDQVVGIVGSTLTKLRELSLPEGDEATIRLIYAKFNRVNVDFQKLRTPIQNGEVAKVKALSAQLDKDTKDANKASIEYGLTVCGE